MTAVLRFWLPLKVVDEPSKVIIIGESKLFTESGNRNIQLFPVLGYGPPGDGIPFSFEDVGCKLTVKPFRPYGIAGSFSVEQA